MECGMCGQRLVLLLLLLLLLLVLLLLVLLLLVLLLLVLLLLLLRLLLRLLRLLLLLLLLVLLHLQSVVRWHAPPLFPVVFFLPVQPRSRQKAKDLLPQLLERHRARDCQPANRRHWCHVISM
jgi:hypothetical protein